MRRFFLDVRFSTRPLRMFTRSRSPVSHQVVNARHLEQRQANLVSIPVESSGEHLGDNHAHSRCLEGLGSQGPFRRNIRNLRPATKDVPTFHVSREFGVEQTRERVLPFPPIRPTSHESG